MFAFLHIQGWMKIADAESVNSQNSHRGHPPYVKIPVSIQKDIRIILTFDDGPHLSRTPRVLDLLDQYGVKALFFVNGERFASQSQNAQKAREILKDIQKRGHLIGNHTVHHYMNLCHLPQEMIEQEISQNTALIEQATGQAPTYFRAPGGITCPVLASVVEKLGMKSVLWDIDSWDWKWRDRNINLAGLELGLLYAPRKEAPSIILMHDIHEESVETLPLFFKWLKTQPHVTIVSPADLSLRPPAPQPVDPQVTQPLN